MKTKTFIFLLFSLPAFIIFSSVVYAQASDRPSVYFFFSETCPHCRNEYSFLKKLEEKYPSIVIHYINIHENFDLYKRLAEKYNSQTGGVPRTFIGDKVFVGFAKAVGDMTYVDAYKAYYGYQNQIEKHILNLFSIGSDVSSVKVRSAPFWIFSIILIYVFSILLFRKKLKINWSFRHWWFGGLIAVAVFSIFIFVLFTPEETIKSFASSLPFPAFVFILSLADGFNPCAFTVLIILLSLLTYTEEKKSMSLIGFAFVATSGLMYFIFIMIMIFFGHWAVDRYGPTIMHVLGIAVLLAGAINVKDYFFFKKGISLSISEKHKLRIIHHARRITNMVKEAETWYAVFAALVATFLLAVFVNLVELGCTAIFPAVYMVSLLQTYPGNVTVQIVWTVMYAVIYIIPLLIILIDFIYTFKSGRLTERQGRILKLISGIFMLVFGIIMVFKPELLMFA